MLSLVMDCPPGSLLGARKPRGAPIGDSATHMPSTNPMLKGPCDSRNMLAVLRNLTPVPP